LHDRQIPDAAATHALAAETTAGAHAGADWRAAAHWIRGRGQTVVPASAIWACFVNVTGKQRVIKRDLNSPDLKPLLRTTVDLPVVIQSTVACRFHLWCIKDQPLQAPCLMQHQERVMSRGSLACTRSTTGNPRCYSAIARVDATVSAQMNGYGGRSETTSEIVSRSPELT